MAPSAKTGATPERVGVRPDPARRSRSIGAMFFTVFGGAWIALWAWHVFESHAAAIALPVAATGGLFALVYGRYRRYRTTGAEETPTEADRRRDRWFHLINAGQWVLILIVGNVLANTGLPAWVIPAAMFIIGLHMVPLAPLFRRPSHYVTGGTLMLIAAVYPFAAPAGAADPVGALAAGLVLWTSALWGVLAA